MTNQISLWLVMLIVETCLMGKAFAQVSSAEIGLEHGESRAEPWTVRKPYLESDAQARRILPGEEDYADDVTRSGFYIWAKTPLRVFSPADKRTSPMQALLFDALDEWCNALGGKLSWKQVSSKSGADIECRWVSRREDLESVGVADQFGHTSVRFTDLQDNRHELTHASITILTTREGKDGKNEELSNSVLRRITMHEVGHAIGLAGHPAVDGYIMSPASEIDHLAPGDVKTVQRLYSDLPGSVNRFVSKAESRRYSPFKLNRKMIHG